MRVCPASRRTTSAPAGDLPAIPAANPPDLGVPGRVLPAEHSRRHLRSTPRGHSAPQLPPPVGRAGNRRPRASEGPILLRLAGDRHARLIHPPPLPPSHPGPTRARLLPAPPAHAPHLD